MSPVGILAVVGFLVASPVSASKILLITGSTYSHCAEVSSVGQVLADRGHDLSILISTTFEHNNCFQKEANGTRRIKMIPVTPAPEVMSVTEITQTLSAAMIEGEEFNIITRAGTMNQFVRSICEDILSDTTTIESLASHNFDLMVVDGAFMMYCFFAIPYKLNVPHIAMSSVYQDSIIGRPFLPSISPDILTKYTDDMSFFQRLGNAMAALGMEIAVSLLTPMDVVQRVAPGLSLTKLLDTVAYSEIFLHNYSPILSYPVPKMPNHIEVGGISTKPAKKLTGDLAEFYKQAPDGVVLVTFGGNTMNLPNKTINALTSALRRLKQKVIWKYNSDEVKGNLKLSKWVPQNDLLGHPKTKVFVSHCGNNGVYEALYHGVPVVCTPILGDQFFNGVRLEHWGVAFSVPLLMSTEDKLYNSITEVLTNPKYRENMKRASEMFHSQPSTPRDRAAFWVEYVLKFGGDHLRSRAADMSVWTFMGYDILCFVVVVLAIALYLTYKCLVVLVSCCRRTKSKEKTN